MHCVVVSAMSQKKVVYLSFGGRVIIRTCIWLLTQLQSQNQGEPILLTMTLQLKDEGQVHFTSMQIVRLVPQST